MDVVDLGDIEEGMIDLVGGKALGLFDAYEAQSHRRQRQECGEHS